MIYKKDPTTIQHYLEDSSNLSGGHAESVVIPEKISEVSDFLRDSFLRRRPVTFSGGGTGESGGRIPFGGAVLSLERLTAIKDITVLPEGGTVNVESGVRIKDLKEAIGEKRLFYSYDPTEQTACVGGTVATNASGARSFKYGSTRSSVQKMTLALADGSCLRIARGDVKEKDGLLVFSAGGKTYEVPVPDYKMPATKTSAGYFAAKGMDLIDLFIGQEGTLGCVLEVSLKLNKKPENILSCFSFFNSEEHAIGFAARARELSFFNRAKKEKGIDALSIEYFGASSLDLLREKYQNVPPRAVAAILFEQETSSGDETGIVDSWLELLERYEVTDDMTWVALNDKARQDLIDKRHSMGESMNELARLHHNPKVATDIAVPHEKFPEMMHFYDKILGSQPMRYFIFGHIGDSHLHMNLIPKNEDELALARKIALDCVKKSVSLGGTVSAEHGIGKMRRQYLKILYGEVGIRQMVKVKRVLDPYCMLGPGNIFE